MIFLPRCQNNVGLKCYTTPAQSVLRMVIVFLGKSLPQRSLQTHSRNACALLPLSPLLSPVSQAVCPYRHRYRTCHRLC